MIPWSLVLVLTSTLAADLSPEELIGRLGSPDRVVREEAARTLEERGEGALPPLRAALEAAEGPEARERLADLIARVEARLLDRPTMVVLDFEDRPLGEAVEALAARSGFALALDDPALAGRRVTARAPGPLPFWEAVDRLGRAGHVRHDPGPRRDAQGNDPRASTIRLVDGDPPAAAYSGPFRVHLFATHRHRDLNFRATGALAARPGIATVTVEVQSFAEPGRSQNPDGLPRLEAVDERGRPTSPDPGGGGQQPDPSERSWLVPGRISLLQWHVPLGLPDRPDRPPLKLRGVLPVVLSSRRPDPLVIPLADAVGKTSRQGPILIRIDRVAAGARDAKSTAVDFFVDEEAGTPDRARVAPGPEADHVGDHLRDRVEFQDAEGHPMSWLLFATHPASPANGGLRVQTLVSGVAPPARLLVYKLHRLATEIPFEFADVLSP